MRYGDRDGRTDPCESPVGGRESPEALDRSRIRLVRLTDRQPTSRGHRLKVVLALLVALGAVWAAAAFSAGSSLRAPRPAAQSNVSSVQNACRLDPHAGVHDPDRLTVLAPCVEIVGTVTKVPKLPLDGDHTFNLRPDPAYDSMMNADNRANDGLHVEIVPMDQPGCTPGKPITKPAGYNNLGVCSGAAVPTPAVGARVRVTGPWVFDRWAGPNEIHPAWKIDVLPGNAPAVTTATTTVAAPATPPPTPRRLKAKLTGRAVVGKTRAPRGTASLAVTIAVPRLCWRFTGVRKLGKPVRAWISLGRPGHVGRRVVALGARYAAHGCRKAGADTVLEPLVEQPGRYYVTLASTTYPAGAVRGQLVRRP